MKKIARRLTFANVVACLALFIALGGASYAALKLPKNSVGTKQLKKNAVTAAKVKPGTLLAKDFRAGQLPAGATGARGPEGPIGAQGTAGAAAVSSPTALPHARIALLSFNEPITTSSRQVVTFDTVVEDNAGMADLTKHPATLQVPRTGLYAVAGALAWQMISGKGRVGGSIEGAKDPAGSEFFRYRSVEVSNLEEGPFVYLEQPMSEVIRLTAGQYVDLVAYQQTGVTNELTHEGDGSWLEVTYLGP
jgi:hypothetical protein